MTDLGNMPNLIVSVESRKGGVGKTTAALCLAHLLLKKGYAVLVLDLDVTGTDAADLAGLPFWKNELHIVSHASKQDNVSNNPLNLIMLFDQCFMTGKTIPEFSSQQTSGESLDVNLKKVNVLGSQIYKTSQSAAGGPTCIERPGTLFDDLHTLWLLEFVKQIVDNFVRFSQRGPSTKQAIILDNSPGYVGIAPAVHEWLTDCGPDCGKFLLVTSLDMQDLRACDRAVSDLHGLYQNKWRTASLFIDSIDSGGEISVSKDQENFFMRLASSAVSGTRKFDPLAFYRNTTQNPPDGQIEKGQYFYDHPAKYIGAIINRVPRAIKDGDLFYEFNSVLRSDSILAYLLDVRDERHGWHERTISYDEYIENQFLMFQRRKLRREPYDWRIRNLMSILDRAERELRTGAHENNDDWVKSFEMDYKHPERLRHQLAKVNDILVRARSTVENEGMGHVARLIHDEWLPGSIIPKFRSVLSRLLTESDFPHFDSKPFLFDASSTDSEAREFVVKLKEDLRMEFYHSNLQETGGSDPETVDVLLSVLSMLVGLSLGSFFERSRIAKDIAGLFALVLNIEVNHWIKRTEAKSHRFSLQRFMAQESVSYGELHRYSDRFKNLRLFRHYAMQKDKTGIGDFYKACTSAQARLIDFARDSRFLLQLLRFIVENQRDDGNLFPFVRGIAEDVIVKKVLPHDEAPARMAKVARASEYFREFNQVLNKILKEWELTNE